MEYQVNCENEIQMLQEKIERITHLIMKGSRDSILREDLNYYREKLQILTNQSENKQIDILD
ncbi:MAG: hypothetical protein GY827_03730 [Cytophagales bacterium]|nr:hypothetical protein [Cytophagales bacterium]